MGPLPIYVGPHAGFGRHETRIDLLGEMKNKKTIIDWNNVFVIVGVS
jgi:hypothetical protein